MLSRSPNNSYYCVFSVPAAGFINPWTGEEIPGIAHDDEDSLDGKLPYKYTVCRGIYFLVWKKFSYLTKHFNSYL